MPGTLDLLFDRRTLLTAVNHHSVKVKPRLIFDRYFAKNTRDIWTEKADYEFIRAKRRLAGFRNQGQAARVVGRHSEKVIHTVTLPYIREKKVLTAKELRSENSLGNVYISGAGDIGKMREQTLNKELTELKESIGRREEWMCCQLITTGGMEYHDPVENVHFKLNLEIPSEFKPVLSGGSRWSESTATINRNLWNWNLMIQRATGMSGKDVILGTDAAIAFMENPDVKKNLDTNNYRIGQVSANLAPELIGHYIGNYGNYDFWMYSNEYEGEDGVTHDFFPPDMAVMLAGNLETEYLYGLNEEVDGEYVGSFFSKSWIEQDPSVRWLLVASRPMPVVKLQGSWVMAKVV